MRNDYLKVLDKTASSTYISIYLAKLSLAQGFHFEGSTGNDLTAKKEFLIITPLACTLCDAY